MISTILFNFILGPIFMLIYATICRCLYVRDGHTYRKVRIPFIFYLLCLIGLAIPYFNIIIVPGLLLLLFGLIDINNWTFSFIDISNISRYFIDELKNDPIYIERKKQFEKDHHFFIICKKMLLKIKTLLFHNINK